MCMLLMLQNLFLIIQKDNKNHIRGDLGVGIELSLARAWLASVANEAFAKDLVLERDDLYVLM